MADKEVLEVLRRVEEKLDRVDAKVDRTNTRLDTVVVRMDTLVDTTNHRLDAFTAALDGKLNNGELLTSLGFKLMNNKLVRWGLGIAAAAIAATTTYEHWVGLVERFFGLTH